MFSKTVFKQTLKSNYKLWLVFTVILCVLSAVIIAVYDPQMMTSMMDMLEDTPMAEMVGDQLDNMTSLLGMLGNSFYGMMIIILPLIYIIITANSLVASQVDRGSMAYTLSTPIKRSRVVATQALYLITSILVMILMIMLVGLTTVQISHGGIIGEAHTEDVKAVASLLDTDRQNVEDDLDLILDNEEAIREGAEARNIEEEIYVAYLNLRKTNKAYEAAAEVLNVEADEIESDLNLLLNNDEALVAAANVMGIDEEEYRMTVEMTIAQEEASAEQAEEMQDKMLTGLVSAAEVLDVEVADLSEDMELLKENQAAMDAAVAASEIPEETFIMIIDQQLAVTELSIDEGLDFDMQDYLMLNLGAFLLLFAVSSISFAASCIFNLSKNSLTIGAGLPVAFFVFQIMSQTGESLEGFKYLSLNTLYDTSEIIGSGSYGVQFAVLAAIGVVLYIVGMQWFKKKDLPL